MHSCSFCLIPCPHFSPLSFFNVAPSLSSLSISSSFPMLSYFPLFFLSHIPLFPPPLFNVLHLPLSLSPYPTTYFLPLFCLSSSPPYLLLLLLLLPPYCLASLCFSSPVLLRCGSEEKNDVRSEEKSAIRVKK